MNQHKGKNGLSGERGYCIVPGFEDRVVLDFPREVSTFVASGQNREVVLFTPGPHARQHCQTYGLATDPISLRLIRVKLKNGEIEVLATPLLDEQTYCAGAWK